MNNSQQVAAIIESLLNERGISVNKMLQDCGLAARLVGGMKNGSMPSADKLATIAFYLGVSTDYLLTGKEANLKNEKEDEEMDGVLKKMDYGLLKFIFENESISKIEILKHFTHDIGCEHRLIELENSKFIREHTESTRVKGRIISNGTDEYSITGRGKIALADYEAENTDMDKTVKTKTEEILLEILFRFTTLSEQLEFLSEVEKIADRMLQINKKA